MGNENVAYWNPVLETLEREKLVEIELRNFRRYMGYAKAHSVFYRKKFKGIEPGDIRTREDLVKLPLTDKEDLRLAQEMEEPTIYGEILGGGQRLSSNLRNHGKAGIRPRELRELAVAGRGLVSHPLDGRIQGD